jgi:hypothetical protein
LQQLQGRLQRCSLQLKQLGAGVAVVAALGLSTPAVGQMPLDFQFESSNPFSSTLMDLSEVSDFSSFIDLDNDGDLDMVASENNTGLLYYENTGTSSNPTYTLLASANDPFPTGFDMRKTYASFLDLDSDGDIDMFVTSYDYYSVNIQIFYYENTGSASTPNFTLRIGTDNPLNDARVYVNSIRPSAAHTYYVYTSFVDIDNDGDQDCFINPVAIDLYGVVWPSTQNGDRIIYYENTGTATTPNYQRQTGTNNPLNGLANALPNGVIVNKKLLFVEGSTTIDGDLDVLASTTNSTQGMYYYENTGTASSPVFASSSYNVLDSAFAKLNVTNTSTIAYRVKALADIDGDNDLELVVNVTNNNTVYLEDKRYINIQQLPAASPIQVYPNPTTGVLQLEQPLTGTAHIYSTLGQELYSQELEQAQQLDITHLPKGTYFLYIRTEEKNYQQTVTLDK